MNFRLLLKLLATALAFSLVAAACGGNAADNSTTDSGQPSDAAAADPTENDMPDEDSEEAAPAAAPAVDTPAATLTRDLTALLVDHEYLAGTAVYTAVQAGGDLKDPTFMAAAGALDNNSVALSQAIEGVYGKAGGDKFLSLWRAHIGFFVDYTLGKATKDDALVAKASKQLDGYRNDFGAFIEGATEGALPKDAVADALTPHVDSTKAAIDSVVAGDGKAFDKLREANSHIPGIATALAGGIDAQMDLEGETDDGAAQLQRDLTALLGEHEYLAGLAVYTAVDAGGDLKDPTFMAAAGALDDNSVALSKAVESVYGEAGGDKFLSLWRAHIGFFVDYTLGKATKDDAMVSKASDNLDGYRNDFGAFIDGATEGGLPKDAVADALTPHVDTTKAAIDSVVAGDGKGFEKLREAASHLPGIATALSGAIVAQFPDKF
jgi:hypothetical protein